MPRNYSSIEDKRRIEREYIKEYRDANPEKVRLASRRNSARERAARILSRRYPTEFNLIYAEQLRYLTEKGK